MRVTITDIVTLGSIHPSRVAYYLRAKGWERVSHEPRRYSLWAKPRAGRSSEVLLPLDSKLGDFAQRMAILLDDLQRDEERSQLEILRDIEVSTCDVFRFRKDPRSGYLGAIQIEEGARLVAHARDLLLYGATAEYDPRRQTVGGRRADDVVRFMNAALLGQTEISSFVVTAQVPVPSALTADMFPEKLAASAEPFERRANVRLMNLLSYTREAALEAAQSSDFRPFSELLAQGATVGLYDTVVEAQEVVPGVPLEIGCSWAPSRPLVGAAPTPTVVFEPEIVAPIREAVNILRPQVPREDVRVVGIVEMLQRPAQEELIGDLAITTLVDGRPKKVYFSLVKPEYDQVIEAFRQRQPIEVTGDLVKQGKHWTLREPRNLRVIGEEESSSD